MAGSNVVQARSSFVHGLCLVHFALRRLVLRLPESIIHLRNAIRQHVIPAIHRLILQSLARLLYICVLLEILSLKLIWIYLIHFGSILKALTLSVHLGGLREFLVEVFALHRRLHACPVGLPWQVRVDGLPIRSLVQLRADSASACLHPLDFPFIVSVLPGLVPLHGAVDVRDVALLCPLLALAALL